MDFLFELIIDLILDVSIEASRSRKVPRFIRYLLILFISLFFIAIIGLIFFMGISILKDNALGGIIVILFGVFLLIMGVIRFRKTYFYRKGMIN